MKYFNLKGGEKKSAKFCITNSILTSWPTKKHKKEEQRKKNLRCLFPPRVFRGEDDQKKNLSVENYPQIGSHLSGFHSSTSSTSQYIHR